MEIKHTNCKVQQYLEKLSVKLCLWNSETFDKDLWPSEQKESGLVSFMVIWFVIYTHRTINMH